MKLNTIYNRIILLFFFLTSFVFSQGTYILPGGSNSGSFGAWGGTGYFYPLTFNVDATGGIDITYYDIDLSQLVFGNSWQLSGYAEPGISKSNSMSTIDPLANSVWGVLVNQNGTRTAWNGTSVTTLGPDNTPNTSDDTRSGLIQDWYLASTGGKVSGPAQDPAYNTESYVTPNDRFPSATPMTASELNTYDFRLRVLPTGGGNYTYEMWVRLHNAASDFEGITWQGYNLSIYQSGEEGAWREFKDGSNNTVFPISGFDFSSVYLFMGLGNGNSPSSQALTWGRIEVTGTPTSLPTTLYVNTGYTAGGVNDGYIWGYNAFSNIQSAINAANNGDEIHVAAGTYVENNFGWTGLQVQNKSIKIIGAGSALTKIQVTNLTHGIEFHNSASPMSIWLEGLTFEPDGLTGPGFFISIGETGGVFDGITMRDVVVSKAEARNVIFEMGGIFSNILIDNCSFVDSKYWGVSFNWLTTQAQTVTITNSKFLRNGKNGERNSTGLEIVNVKDFTMTGCTFNRNRAIGLVMHQITNATINNSTWWRNGESETAGTPNSTISPNYRCGISIWEDGGSSSNINIFNSTISETFGRGMVIGTYLAENTINGVYVDNCTFFDNNFSDTGWDHQNLVVWETLPADNGTAFKGGPVTNAKFYHCNFIDGSFYGNPEEFTDIRCNNWNTLNASQIQARVNGRFFYDPWLGKPFTATQTSVSYDNICLGVNLQFTTLPSGGGDVSVVRHEEA